MDKKARELECLNEARGLCDLADREARDFTPAEREKVNALLAEAKRLKAELLQEKSDTAAGEAALKAMILELGGGGWHGAPAGKAGPWSAAFVKGLNTNYGGRKDFLPVAGSVGVPPVMNTVNAMSDVGRVETILQFIPQPERLTGDVVSFLRETVRTHNAAVVAPLAVKPTSVYTLERVDDRARTIAHLTEPISRNWLSDAPMLRQYIDGTLREGLLLAVEDEVLNGDGTGEHFTGIFHAGVGTQPFMVDVFTSTRQAITTLELRNVIPTAWAFNPTDWESFELQIDLVDQYKLKGAGQDLPVDRARRRLWGLPVGLSTQMPVGAGILGQWPAATQLWPREEATVDWSEAFTREVDGETKTGFMTNSVQFRAEQRAAFGVTAPRRMLIVDLEAGS